MSHPTDDAGIIQALLERLNSQRLPLALAMKDKVDAGEILSGYDISKLDEMLSDAQALQPLIERNLNAHPEHQGLVVSILQLYTQITERAMENEKRG
jgi:hypothetical protein